MAAPVVQVVRYRPDEIPQTIVIPDDQLQPDGLVVFNQRIPTGLVLLIGMDVGVVPEADGLDALAPEGVHAVDAARGAAGVKQEPFHGKILPVHCEWMSPS